MQDEKLLVGVARWANHSCCPNCDYYMKGGFRGRACIRLHALCPILPNQELCTFYNEDVFGIGNCGCLCQNVELHAEKDGGHQTVSKKSRKSVPRIKVVEKKPSTNLQSFIEFFDEGSNLSIQSFEGEENNRNLVLDNFSDNDSEVLLPQDDEVEGQDQSDKENLPSLVDYSCEAEINSSD